MRRFVIAICLCGGQFFTNPAYAIAVDPFSIGLANTGLDASGSALPSGLDPHYVGLTEAAVVAEAIHQNWVPNSSSARWIGPVSHPVGYPDPPGHSYSYELAFGAVGVTPLLVTGVFAADNSAQLLLNGSLAAQTPSDGQYSTTPFTLDDSFLSGINVLTFIVTNAPCPQCGDNPTGLLVRFDSAEVAFVPEPGTFPLVLCAAFGVWVFAFRNGDGSVRPAIGIGKGKQS